MNSSTNSARLKGLLQLKANTERSIKDIIKQTEKLMSDGTALTTKLNRIDEECEQYFDTSCKELAVAVFTKFPVELRAMIYYCLHDPLEDIHVRRREIRGEKEPRHYGYHLWPEVVGEAFAMEAAEDFCRRTRFIIDDADDVEKALELDVFNNGKPASEFVRHIQVDVRTHHFGTKTRKLKPVSVYDNTANNLQSILNVKNVSECRLNIRILTDGFMSPWSIEVLKTLACIRPLVRQMQERGMRVKIELAYYASKSSEPREDLTEDFELDDEGWRKLLATRRKLAKQSSLVVPVLPVS
ncbi:hypothetical protein BDV96DRAFT_571953 [Lophiotrema nucula]|uniref:Uncharacterized protein n=1 Tax=Lophiotrema nucula TaxID=690887 RepID=A0A6A5ZCW9_9PLEO|nr:hypothetical protein BDV96DRAFT_571953 [Lophiotrema nucula]